MLFRIQNFQSIEDHTFEFLPGSVAIIGESNRGKSAVMRALRALLYNEWGHRWQRDGSKKTELTLEFSKPVSGIVKIYKVKSKSLNFYNIEMSDGEVREFPKVGNSVPDIMKDLKFDILKTDRGDSFNLNFQNQLDPLFLFGENEPALTSFFNSIFKLVPYENALRDMTGDLKKVNSQFSDNEEKLGKLEDKKVVCEEEKVIVEKKLEEVEKINKNLILSYDRISEIERAVEKLKGVKSLVDRIDKLESLEILWKKLGINLNKIVEKVEKKLKIDEKVFSFNVAVEDLKKLEKLKFSLFKFLEYLKKYLGSYNKIQASHGSIERVRSKNNMLMKVGESINLLESFNKYMRKVVKNLNLFKSLEDSICRNRVMDLEIESLSEDLRKLKEYKVEENKYRSFLHSIVKLCPTCGKKF